MAILSPIEKIETIAFQLRTDANLFIPEYNGVLNQIAGTDKSDKRTADFAVKSFDGTVCKVARCIDEQNGIFMIIEFDSCEPFEKSAEIVYLSNELYLELNSIGPNIDCFLYAGKFVEKGPILDPRHIDTHTGKVTMWYEGHQYHIQFNTLQRQILEDMRLWHDYPPFDQMKDINHIEINHETILAHNIKRLMAWAKYVLCDYCEWVKWKSILTAIETDENLKGYAPFMATVSGFKEEW